MKREAAYLDPVTRMELATAPILGLVVDPHTAGRQQRLGLAAVVGHAGELEQLAEPDGVAADGDILGGHSRSLGTPAPDPPLCAR